MFQAIHYRFLTLWLRHYVDKEAREKIARSLSAELKAQSGKFDEAKFLKACGVQS